LRIQDCGVNDGGRRSEGRRRRGNSTVSHLLAVDHEFGEEASVGGAHEISRDRRGRRWPVVELPEMTCVIGGRRFRIVAVVFGVKRCSDRQLEDVCSTFIF
jgi:hypothetical protein